MKTAASMLRRVATAALLGGVLVASLAGCGAMPLGGVEDDWHSAPSHPPLPSYNVVVDHSEQPKICGNDPGKELYGCAQRMVSANVCIIYTAAKPADWLLEHERKHCAGYDHGKPVMRPAAVSR